MDAEYADRGRRVIVRNRYGETLTGALSRTLLSSSGEPVYEVELDGLPDYTLPGRNVVRRLASDDTLEFANPQAALATMRGDAVQDAPGAKSERPARALAPGAIEPPRGRRMAR